LFYREGETLFGFRLHTRLRTRPSRRMLARSVRQAAQTHERMGRVLRCTGGLRRARGAAASV